MTTNEWINVDDQLPPLFKPIKAMTKRGVEEITDGFIHDVEVVLNGENLGTKNLSVRSAALIGYMTHWKHLENPSGGE